MNEGLRTMSRDILDQLREEKAFLAANRVTDEELGFLEQVELFGKLKTLDDVLLVLRNLRGTDSGP